MESKDRIQEDNKEVEENKKSPMEGSSKTIISSLANKEGMDDANKKAYDVLMKGTEKEFLQHIFTDQATGRSLSYSEMRMRYG